MRISVSFASLTLVGLWSGLPAAGQGPMPPAPSIFTTAPSSRFQWRFQEGPVGLSAQEEGEWFTPQMAADGAGRLVALGSWVEPDDVPVWYSLDGVAWHPATFPGVVDRGLADVIGLAGGFLVVGGDTTWWSPDGVGWEERSRIPGAVLHVLAAAGDRLVVGGQIGPDEHPTAATWTSDDDGATWRRSPFDEGLAVDDIATSPDGTVVLLGLVPTTVDLAQALWVIIDGETFRLDPFGRPSNGRFWQVTGLSWTDAGFLLTASRSRKDDSMVAAMWRSSDGRSWTKAFTTDGLGGTVHAANGLLLWFGTEVPANRHVMEGWVATSSDGTSWQLDAFWDDSRVIDVVTVTDHVLASGEYDDTFTDTWVGMWSGRTPGQ